MLVSYMGRTMLWDIPQGLPCGIACTTHLDRCQSEGGQGIVSEGVD